MKKTVIAALLAVLALAGCKKNKTEKPLDITGTWNLTGIETKAVQIGDETVDVYVEFVSDNTFNLYQMIGQGRYVQYDGTWALDGTTLTGAYTDGTAWGSSYEVSVADGTLVLSCDGEVYTYTAAEIPADLPVV